MCGVAADGVLRFTLKATQNTLETRDMSLHLQVVCDLRHSAFLSFFCFGAAITITLDVPTFQLIREWWSVYMHAHH